jgi:DNA-binding response OmpR family regulator
MTAPRGEPARGLVADDDDLIRVVMRAALESHGVMVVEAATGEAAVAAADSLDFAIVDARMPGLSLVDTIFGLRARSRIPILVMSGAPPDAELPTDVEYLAKPLDLQLFLTAVDRLIVSRDRPES